MTKKVLQSKKKKKCSDLVSLLKQAREVTPHYYVTSLAQLHPLPPTKEKIEATLCHHAKSRAERRREGGREGCKATKR